MIPNNSSRIELSANAIAHNVSFVKKQIGKGVKLSAVIKANAYGHGINQMVPELENNGVSHFSVFSSFEAREVAAASKKGACIMIMGDIAKEDVEWVVSNDIECFVYNFYMLQTLVQEAKHQIKKVGIHIEVETGMNRHGFRPFEWQDLSDKLSLFESHIALQGICTHFAGAESSANYKRVLDQQKVFLKALAYFREKNHVPKNVHTSCSAAMLAFPEFNHDMVRVGILLYGLWPSSEMQLHYKLKYDEQKSPLKTVLSWKSHIIDISNVDSGDFIGYGNSFLAETDMKVAFVPVGYGYGFSRSLSNQGRVIVNGSRLSVIGVVNMNMFLVDATNVDLKIGDEVTIIGSNKSQEIKVADFGNLSNQLNYELLTRIDKSIPRVLVP